MATMPMNTPQDLFMHELSAQLSAEREIETMLDETIGLIQNPELGRAVKHHLDQTRQQATNLERAIRMAGGRPHAVHCHTVEGLQHELHEALAANPSPMVLEGLLLGSAARTEHLEIAVYTDLVTKATAMGMREVADLLQQNLDQERSMLENIQKLATNHVQRMASGSMGMGVGASMDQGSGAAHGQNG